jgi:hypothetical protein
MWSLIQINSWPEGQLTASPLSRTKVRSVCSKPLRLSSWNGDASSNAGLGRGGGCWWLRVRQHRVAQTSYGKNNVTWTWTLMDTSTSSFKMYIFLDVKDLRSASVADAASCCCGCVSNRLRLSACLNFQPSVIFSHVRVFNYFQLHVVKIALCKSVLGERSTCLNTSGTW